MNPVRLAALAVVFFTGCVGESVPDQEKGSLVEARRGFQPKLVPRKSQGDPIPDPPPEIFRKVVYDSPAGKLGAYISQVPDDGQKRPAIVWITGGDCNSIDDLWSDADPSNDQTASAYRKAGIVMMFPSLRGGNDNPGIKEAFLGEVDDVLAATNYLAQQESVDPRRIYLGGHSTGGTLALLVAESTDRFRAVFSFGPASDVSNYPSGVDPVRHIKPARGQAAIAGSLAELDPRSHVCLRGNPAGQSRVVASDGQSDDQPDGPLPAGARRDPFQHPRSDECADRPQDPWRHGAHDQHRVHRGRAESVVRFAMIALVPLPSSPCSSAKPVFPTTFSVTGRMFSTDVRQERLNNVTRESTPPWKSCPAAKRWPIWPHCNCWSLRWHSVSLWGLGLVVILGVLGAVWATRSLRP